MLQTLIPTFPVPQANYHGNDGYVDFIGHGRARVAWNDKIRDVAKEVLDTALASAGYGEAGGRSTYGNQSGRELLEERHDMKDRMNRLEDMLINLKDELTKETTSRQRLENELTKETTSRQRLENELTKETTSLQRLENELTKETTSRQRLENELTKETTSRQRLENELTNETTSRQNEIADLKDEVADLQHQNADLQHHVRDLRLASKGYRRIRHRFLNVYRRDVLGDAARQEYQQIRDGNNAAHGGDAVTDASLYTSDERYDEDVLIKLYGLSASEISYQARAGHTDCIDTIDTGATWMAKGPNNIPRKVAAAFTTFVNELSMNPDESITDGTTPLSKAYNAFWEAHWEALRRLG